MPQVLLVEHGFSSFHVPYLVDVSCVMGRIIGQPTRMSLRRIRRCFQPGSTSCTILGTLATVSLRLYRWIRYLFRSDLRLDLAVVSDSVFHYYNEID